MRYVVSLVNAWGVDFADVAALAVVYIEEAHATDEWPISSARLAAAPVAIAAHKTIDDRLAAATSFARDYAVPLDRVALVADGMGNAFQSAYASWPIRWFVFEARSAGDVVVVRIGEPDEASFDMWEVAEELRARRGE